MREQRSQTTPRRRGPKMPLPIRSDEDPYAKGGGASGRRGRTALYDAGASESPYYTIDNTEDIYGTTLLPSERCFVDPWDLENYDYVRKKLQAPPVPPAGHDADDFYDITAPTHAPSPQMETLPVDLDPVAGEEDPYMIGSQYYYMEPRLSVTMPRQVRRRSQHIQCQLPCCAVTSPQLQSPRRHYDDQLRRDHLYGLDAKYNQMLQSADLEEHNIYTGYGGFSSSSSTERHSSIEDDSMMQSGGSGGSGGIYGETTLTRNRRLSRKFEFPAPPPPMPSSYDYCSPYATLPCSVSDCYECLSSMYGSTSIYGTGGVGVAGGGIYGTTLRRPASALYDGIYSTKFGLSKKGLLQIDYECSWNDLGRVMGRNY